MEKASPEPTAKEIRVLEVTETLKKKNVQELMSLVYFGLHLSSRIT